MTATAVATAIASRTDSKTNSRSPIPAPPKIQVIYRFPSEVEEATVCYLGAGPHVGAGDRVGAAAAGQGGGGPARRDGGAAGAEDGGGGSPHGAVSGAQRAWAKRPGEAGGFGQ